MKRLPIGIGVLLVLIVLSIWTGQKAKHIHGDIVEKLEQAAQAASWGETAPAERAKDQWDDHRTLTAAITDHTALDEIEAGFAELEVYRRQEDLTHFTATCARLSELIRAVEEGHELSWENVL